MAANEINAVAGQTGTYAALRLPVDAKRASGKAEPAAGKPLPQAAQERPDMAQLARKLNIASKSIGRDLRFEVDMKTGRSVIQVLDRDTGEIIRQIPPEKAQSLVSSSGNVTLRLLDERI